jgi:geranylgeranyl diphosphate synthase type I
MHDDTLSRIAGAVEQRLERVFAEARAGHATGLFPGTSRSPILEQVRDLTLRSGKRVRAALLVCGAALFDDEAESNPGVIDAAAAMELLHSYFLIHDDIMDDDPTRRGGPAVHVALAALAGEEKLGRDLAILAGDLAVALHEGLLAGLPAPDERRRLATRIFAEMHLDVVHGQTMDLLGSGDAEEVARRKTASYTTVGPLAAGAALAGASEREIERLAGIARPLGVAFQLRDDLLGVFGSPERTGKPVGTDLRAGKATFLVREGLRRCDGAQRAAVEAVLGHEDADPLAVGEAAAILERCGARRACEERIDELVGGAVAELRQERYLDGGRKFLERVAALVRQRIA